MRNLFKWLLIIGAGLFLSIIIALVLIPFFVDMNQYKGPLEKKISTSIGRAFSIGGDLELSLFPWAGISFTDLYLGNPNGFENKDFIRINEFDVRVKLLPLIFKNVEVKRFILDGAQISYITLKSGRSNIDGLIPAEAPSEEKTAPPDTDAEKKAVDLPFKSFKMGEFAITNARILIDDQRQNTRNEIRDITLVLNDVSFETPIKIKAAATIDGKAIAAQGQAGPLGNPAGKADIPFDLTLTVLGQMTTQMRGTVTRPTENPGFILDVETKPFSARKLLAALAPKAPLVTADPAALEKISFKTNITGTPQSARLTDGKLVIDDTTIVFSGEAKEFDKPDVTFTASLDQMDVDRYLPPAASDETAAKTGNKPVPAGEKPDFAPLRKLVLNVKLNAGALKAANAKMENLTVSVKGRNGVFTADPMAFAAYDGKVSATARLDVRTDTPAVKFGLNASDISSNPLVKDLMEKDIIEGALNAFMTITTNGMDPVVMKRNLNGTGELAFKNGAIKGVDLTSLSRNVQTLMGKGGTGEASQARTDFAEFICPIDISAGVVKTTQTRLASPLIRLTATGTADLNTEALDFRIEPKFVATITGQGDTGDRSGFKVPVLISGTLTEPKFTPDVKSIVQDVVKDKLNKKAEELLKNSNGGNSDALRELLDKSLFGR